jgi:sugar phosphate isomerase/epimerase
MALAKSNYAVPTWTRFVALVTEHPALRAAITGGTPGSIRLRLLPLHREAPHLQRRTDRVTASLHAQLREYGRNVVFQVDLYWATRGGADPVELLERYGNRIQLFDVKDMAAGPFPGRIEIVGEGIIDFPEIFAASRGPVRYYVVEHDPRFGDPTFDPFAAAEKGFDYLDCVTF